MHIKDKATSICMLRQLIRIYMNCLRQCEVNINANILQNGYWKKSFTSNYSQPTARCYPIKLRLQLFTMLSSVTPETDQLYNQKMYGVDIVD